LANTKDAVSDLLSVDETYLSNSFIESEETLTLLEEAAEGSAEAIDKLQILAAKSILIDLSADDSELRATLLEYHDSLFNEEWNKSIKIGATIDNEGFIANANKIVEKSKMTVEEAQAYFSSLGYEPTFVETTIKEPLTGTRTITKNVVTNKTKSGYEYIESADTVEEPIQLSGTKDIKVPLLSDDGVP
jgi:hypothetical protein